MNHIIKHYKKLIRFLIPMVMTAVLCITSPTLAQITKSVTDNTFIAQNQSASTLEKQGRSHYEKGNFSQASKLFLQASQAYKSASDPIRQALSF